MGSTSSSNRLTPKSTMRSSIRKRVEDSNRSKMISPSNNMKLSLALVALLIECIQASSGANYDYSAVAQIRPTKKEAHQGVKDYSLTLDPSTIKLLMPWSTKDNKKFMGTITALEFEICRDGPDAGFAHRLGSGTFGGVFAGRLSTTNAEPIRVAIKIEGQYNCCEEATYMERLNNPVDNPAINNCYAEGNCASPAHDEDAYPRHVVVMELVTGRSLESYIVKDKATRTSTQQLPENARISIIHQVANTLEYMWDKGCVHGDLADRNIMVTEDEGRYNIVLIDFGKTVSFEDVHAAGKGYLPNEDKPYNDLKDLAVLCKDLGLEEHIKVFPLGHNKALMSSPKANKYVHEMNQHPELFAKHLLPSEGHPATEFLPGLPGYAEFKCKDLPRDEEKATEYERVLSQRAEEKATDYETILSQRAQVNARKERVYVAIIMWRYANKTDRNPVPKKLKEYVTTPAFQESTKNHPAFAESKIVYKDIWKYGVQLARTPLTVDELEKYAIEIEAAKASRRRPFEAAYYSFIGFNMLLMCGLLVGISFAYHIGTREANYEPIRW